MTRSSLVCLVCLALPVSGAEIRWSAAGTVSSVSAGFSAAVGDPVAVRFSYASAATPNGLTKVIFPNSVYARTEFCGSIALTMEVAIGTQVWSARVPVSPPGGTFALLTEAWSGTGSPDTFTILAATADAGVFMPFPYTGGNANRSIQVALTDTKVPTGFLALEQLPTAATPVSEITGGSGSVGAGTARINFTIDPASVAVSTEPPTFSLTLTRTPAGIELRWPTDPDLSYRLEEGDTLADWQPYGTYPGTGGEIVVTLNPFEDYPQRRFFRVVRE